MGGPITVLDKPPSLDFSDDAVEWSGRPEHRLACGINDHEKDKSARPSRNANQDDT
jgi:hypothetical protein